MATAQALEKKYADAIEQICNHEAKIPDLLLRDVNSGKTLNAEQSSQAKQKPQVMSIEVRQEHDLTTTPASANVSVVVLPLSPQEAQNSEHSEPT